MTYFDRSKKLKMRDNVLINRFPDSYVKTKEHMRNKYGIREGQHIKIMHLAPEGIRGSEKIFKVKIFSVDEFHVTVEFPRGYRQSIPWKKFMEEIEKAK